MEESWQEKKVIRFILFIYGEMDTIDRILEQKNEQIKELEEENDKLKLHIEAKDKAYMDLLADYNYLKARIKKIERAFLKYEDKQEKLLGDLDMIVMNR